LHGKHKASLVLEFKQRRSGTDAPAQRIVEVAAQDPTEHLERHCCANFLCPQRLTFKWLAVCFAYQSRVAVLERERFSMRRCSFFRLSGRHVCWTPMRTACRDEKPWRVGIGSEVSLWPAGTVRHCDSATWPSNWQVLLAQAGPYSGREAQQFRRENRLSRKLDRWL